MRPILLLPLMMSVLVAYGQKRPSALPDSTYAHLLDSRFFPLDTIAIGKVYYQQEMGLPAEIPKNGNAVLLFNNTSSLYFNLAAPVDDQTALEDMLAPQTGAGDKYGFPYYKLHGARQIFYRDRNLSRKGKYLIADTLGGIAWSLQPEHKRFGKYDARRATGTFRGRDYEVWYTLDIPIPSGPFKLGGLPGLILEAQTTDGAVKFLFIRLETGSGIPNPIKPPPDKFSGLDYEAYSLANWTIMSDIIKQSRAAGNDVTIAPSQDVIELWEAPK